MSTAGSTVAPTVRVPASSANLGPAFDAVALALTRYVEATPGGDDPAPATHPAVRAFVQAGGEGSLTVRSQVPGGRGLGFSGAARIAGLVAARVQRGEAVPEAADRLLAD